MAEITISFNDIFWLCSFIAALYGIWKIVKEIRKPYDDLNDTVAKHKILRYENLRYAKRRERGITIVGKKKTSS